MVKAGILGGGQLGRMLLQAAINYPVETYILENDDACPSAHLCHHFIKGDITNYDAVYAFGKMVDVLTIEIENVNVAALEQLAAEGVKVFPKPAALKTIKSKIAQKTFYKENEIPSSDFLVTNTIAEVTQQASFLPAVHKIDQGGYDGKGVVLLKTTDDITQAFDAPSVMEKMVDIKKEISIIIAVNEKGQTAIYEPTDMVVDQRLNLLSYQISPASLTDKVLWKAEAIALKVVNGLKSPGIFAVEMFVDHNENVWVNETAPRVHNSGHHSIEACYSSQFDMLWRVLLNYPLGNTEHILPSAIINLVGEAGHTGIAEYEGLDAVLNMTNVFVHIYGKKQTKPGRKMGHVTVLSNEPQELLHKANQIKNVLKVIAKK
ncbi:5-(carboxyamino)imidazole ribonucleotide synthase [Ferruginibacter yonginensis]|uniref:N5-carboxyaminoimidazole ribonucleotide synthase n=1 Tax=Ferruginibacter yonginensis TaxID=1310416 RepID=A0ABV8QNB0_9BACT